MRVRPQLSISTTNLKVGVVGKGYKASLKANGGKKPFSWSLISGSLPAGLSFDSTTGKVVGTPTVAGSSNLTFQVTDPLGGSSRKTLTLIIN